MPKKITEAEYEDSFPGSGLLTQADDGKRSVREAALEHALDIRKFEIQLYWTRSAYFWTFIGAALVAYGGTQTLSVATPAESTTRTDLSVLVCCVGLVFSVAWFLANKGSKQWQENWENHVDRLEDDVTGPLYKTVLRRPPAPKIQHRLKDAVTGPSPYSVSKINQIVSLYICVVWAALLWSSLPPFTYRPADLSPKYTAFVGSCLLVLLCLGWLARTHPGDMVHSGSQRGITFDAPAEESHDVAV